MTIKRNGEKVILKGGKVSCSCCEEPEECCMYPAQALVDGLYTYEDLPDAIEWLEGSGNPTIYDKLNPPESSTFGLAYYLAQGSAPIGSGDEDVVVLRSDVDPASWERNSGGLIGGPGLCLINAYNENLPGDTFEDQFADTYTVTINPPDDNAGTYTVTRRSICVWSTQVEESGEPGGLKLSYIDAVIGGGFAYTWEIELDTSYIKDGFANTPTGDYSGGNATVS